MLPYSIKIAHRIKIYPFKEEDNIYCYTVIHLKCIKTTPKKNLSK